MRLEGFIEGVVPAKEVQSNQGDKGKKKRKKKEESGSHFSRVNRDQHMIFLLVSIVQRRIIHHSNVAEDQTNRVRNVR